MQENNGKNFIWLFVGLFVLLFGFAAFNSASGHAKNTTANVDDMIKAIVQSESVISDQPATPDYEPQTPEEAALLQLIKEYEGSHKLVGDLLYEYNPNTNITKLSYSTMNGTAVLYDSSEGFQFSEKVFAPYREKLEETYAQTL